MSHNNLARLLFISDVEHDSGLVKTRAALEAYLDLRGQRREDNYKATPEAVHERQSIQGKAYTSGKGGETQLREKVEASGRVYHRWKWMRRAIIYLAVFLHVAISLYA
jgi:hypothetical protein